MPFASLQLKEPLLRALTEEGYTAPTPIQVQAIPHALAGRDLLALAQTGTGKTAAFALPILHRLAPPPAAGRRPVRVLVLVPTRELASQVGESFAAYGRHLPFRHVVIYGGVGQGPQTDALARGVDILVATPGRLLDLVQQRHAQLGHVEVFVLDEADRMLDMGFLPDVKRVIATIPAKRQTLFFSATMPPEAQTLADRILVNPARVAVAPPATTVEKVTQSVYLVEKPDKPALLEHLLQDPEIERALVFTRTKRGADRVTRFLVGGGVRAAAIHGDKSQNHRERALGSFRGGGARVLVATDIAARGIDVEGITHVVNFDIPNVPETYVHRIGRTARAGATGIAIAFCDETEDEYLRDIEKAIRMRIPVVPDHKYRRVRGAPGRPHAPSRPAAPAAPRPEGVPGPWTDPAATPPPSDDARPPQRPHARPTHAARPTHGRTAHGRPTHGRPTGGGAAHRGPAHGAGGHGGRTQGPAHRGSTPRGPTAHGGPSAGGRTHRGTGQGGAGGSGHGGSGQGGAGQGGTGHRAPSHRNPSHGGGRGAGRGRGPRGGGGRSGGARGGR